MSELLMVTRAERFKTKVLPDTFAACKAFSYHLYVMCKIWY